MYIVRQYFPALGHRRKPGGFVKTQTAGLRFLSFTFSRSGVGSENLHFRLNFTWLFMLLVQGIHFENLYSQPFNKMKNGGASQDSPVVSDQLILLPLLHDST